jgi:hypothetical protein
LEPMKISVVKEAPPIVEEEEDDDDDFDFDF